MIAASTARASNEPAPKVSQFRISRYHGAERARCAVPRLSPQSGPSPSAFRRLVTTRAAARTCRHAAFFRLVRAGVAAALVALAALAFPLPAAAQSPTYFVSNTGQPYYRESYIERDRAQRFTTGSHANGYDLSGIRLMFGRGYHFLSVSVCMTDTNGFPTSSCTPLTFKQEWTGDRRGSGIPVNPALYTTPANTVLHPNTTYAVLVRAGNLVALPLTRSNANDAGASSGWSIGDSFDCFNCGSGGPPHTWVPHDEASLQIQILGTERPDPIVAALRSVAVTSTPALTSSGATSPDTYAVGEPIYFTATFNNGVAVTGDPEFEFSLGSPNPHRRAAYDAGRSTPRKLVFGYTVQATDVDTNGIWVGDQTRTLKLDDNDGILTSAGGAAANLAHRSLGTQSAHKVDGTRSPPAGVELDPPLTASLSGSPEHDGRTAFKLTLTFSEEVSIGYRTVRERLFTVSGAAITDVRRLDPRSNLRFEVTVRPSGMGAVTLARAALPACGESDTICTADGRALEGPPTLTVPGTALLSVADATVEEGPDAALAFAVTLDRERHAPVTVSFATSDGSATAGQDYTAASGTLTFAAGETAKTVSVAVLDDTDIEGVETFTLSLSSATGARIADGRAVGTIENPASEMEARLLASLSGVPAGHDGRTPFNLTLTFSEEVSMSYKTVRDGLFAVSGGTIPKVRRLNPSSNLRYEVTVEPGGNDPVRLARAALPACGQSGSICTSDGRALEGELSATVPGPRVPFTASLSGVPAEHDGATAFKLTLTFSEEVPMSYKTVRDDLFKVSEGTIPSVRRLNPSSNLRYEVTVQPGGNDAVMLERAELPACGESGSICTPGGRPLEGAVSATVPGPAGLSVADARVEEAENVAVDFAVTMSRASTETVTVSYATSDGTATQGEDYTAASGKLSFAPGETKKTVSVTVIDDSHDEGEETFTLTLSNLSGGNVFLADASATGTIVNTDPLPRALMARFGRMVGSQVLEAVTQRLHGSPSGSHLTVGGVSLGGGSPLADPLTPQDWLAAQMAHDADAYRPQELTLTGRDLLLGSSFHLVSDAEGSGGAALSAWGRISTGGFRAEADGMAMDGDVTTGLLGFDAEWKRWLAGLLLAHSEGDGAYSLSEGDRGSITTTLTGVYPYARLTLGGRLSAWGLAGIGGGDLTLARQSEVIDTGLALQLGAVGVKGTLLDNNVVDLAVKSDALWVRTESDAATGLAGTSAQVSRVRLVLEAGSTVALSSGAVLTPTVQVGLRHDGGDADTGTGVEVGAGLGYAAGVLTIEAQVRTLLAHESGGYEEWGASGAIRLSPHASGLGPSLTVLPSWGAPGAAAATLWSHPDASALVHGSPVAPAPGRLDAELGYGLPALHGLGMLTPYARVGLAEGDRQSWHLGTRLALDASLHLSVEGSRRHAGSDTAHDLALRVSLPW